VRTCDVTLIFGVGRTYASVLEAKCSIRTWKRLINCDEEEVSDIFRSVGYHMVTPAVVAKWKLHAQAYSTALPALRVQPVPFPVGDAYLALDLEYDEASHVWLIGAYVVSGTDCTHILGWGDDDHQEKKALRTLMKVVTANAHLPVVTWSGTSADIPVLVKAGQRSRVNVEPLLERHVDLYTWVDANLRLPIPRFGLTEVAAYFGIPRVSAISGGLEAVTKYRRCVATGDVALREQLLDYNRDDLDCLVGVVHHLRALFVGRE
jgi:predicted RecB family nuclease